MSGSRVRSFSYQAVDVHGILSTAECAGPAARCGPEEFNDDEHPVKNSHDEAHDEEKIEDRREFGTNERHSGIAGALGSGK